LYIREYIRHGAEDSSQAQGSYFLRSQKYVDF